jgi:hypothetical protein
MDLGNLWEWDYKKLGCRIRVETGNPAGDDLRERIAELAKVDLKELLSDMKTNKKKQESANKSFVDYSADKKYKEFITRSQIIGASQIALTELEKRDGDGKEVSKSKSNANKLFMMLPSSPPKRVSLDIQRERSKPVRMPEENEKNKENARIARSYAKQRAARLAAIEQSAKDEEEAAKLTVSTNLMSREKLQNVFPPYKGDLFSTSGDYMSSMLYLSRLADSVQKSKRLTYTLPAIDTNRARDNTPKAENREHQDRKEKESSSNVDDGSSGFNEHSGVADIGAKLYCATSLCNWARNPANAERLAAEGGVRAIMLLSLEDVPRITMFCAAAFRYMSEQPVLALSMIEENASMTIIDIINSNADEFILGNLAIALVNLTRVNGKEAQIVDPQHSNIAMGLLNLMTNHDLSTACARGLYNLTCVDTAYPNIDRVIRALVSLASSGSAGVKHICAAAFCNLSDLKQVRTRIVEEGAISVLQVLGRGSETRTKRICAVILQNLSASKTCRVEMVSRNSVNVAYGLSVEQDPIILRCIGLTLSRLASDKNNCSRIINESGITALCNIAVKYPTIPGITQPVAAAFQLLSKEAPLRASIVQEGSVTAIATLLRLAVDMFTLQHILLSLCNLLSEADNHLPIVQQGLILTLIALCAQDNDVLKDLSALAFLNLSKAEDSKKHLVNAGAIPAIISLATHKSTVTQARCAATLCNVSAYEVGLSRMVNEGIIPALVLLVRSEDLATVRSACAALCRICSTVENGNLIMDSGAIPDLVQRALGGDDITRQFCGAVLSALTIYESCRIKLCDMGLLSAMTSLADINDDTTKQRCLAAFANISCEESIHERMVANGVVEIVARLATMNSYFEVNYICCAKTLCNLGCSKKLRVQIAESNGIQALMMISLVHSVDIDTKLLCAMALSNILDESTVSFMLSEGLVGATANLIKTLDERIINYCCKLFNQLTYFPAGCEKMAEKHAALNSLFWTFNSENVETKIVCARTVCNLVLNKDVRKRVIDCGALAILDKGLSLNDEACKLHCVQALFSACSEPVFLVKMTHASIHFLIGQLALKSEDGEKYTTAVKILAMMCWCLESRVLIQTKEFCSLIVRIILRNLHPSSVLYLTNSLYYLCLEYSKPEELLAIDVLTALTKIHDMEVSGATDANTSIEINQNLCEIIRSLCTTAETATKCATAANIQIMNRALTTSGSHAATVYNVAVSLTKMSFAGTEARTVMSMPQTVTAFTRISKYPQCTEFVIKSLLNLLNDPRSRLGFANLAVGQIAIATISADCNPNVSCLSKQILLLHEC